MTERDSSAASVPSPAFAAARRWGGLAVSYIRVLKPKETLLLWFIGLCTALAAAGGGLASSRFLLVALTVLLGSGGTNGLTNYLDRHVDAKMKRTRHRVLACGAVSPAWKGLIWSGCLVVMALGIAYYLHPYAFIAGAVRVVAAVVARKTWATHFLGAISSVGPVLVAWFGMNAPASTEVWLLSAVVLLWVPVHVWNLMLAWKEDYVQAGVDMFPLTRGHKLTSALSLMFSVAMLAAVVALAWIGETRLVFLGMAGPAALAMVAAGAVALWRPDRQGTLRVFKLSAYPFLGMTFLGLVLDTWLRAGMW